MKSEPNTKVIGKDSSQCASDARTIFSSRRFAGFWAISLVGLLGVTAPLWLSRLPSGESPYPTIEWINLPLGDGMLFAIDMLLLTGTALGCIAILCAKRESTARRLWCCVGVFLAGLVLLDQHRLQPWIYQSFLYSIALACCRWPQARKLICAIAMSVYFYSSLGKFDFQFVHTVGRQMVQAMMSPLVAVSDSTAVRIAFGLPATELLLAVLLVIPRTRRTGGCMAIGMHLSLIALLGPWGLGHSWGVLVWNAVLAVQSWLLFVTPWQTEAIATTDAESNRHSIIAWLAYATTLLAVTMPLVERTGYWDHWTSWALYSPHSSRVDVEIHRSAIYKLPSGVVPFLLDDVDDDGWSTLDLSTWSLDQRGVPVYPQARYQLMIGLSLAETYDLQKAIRAKRKDVSDRWTGAREETYLIGIQDLRKNATTFWFN